MTVTLLFFLWGFAYGLLDGRSSPHLTSPPLPSLPHAAEPPSVLTPETTLAVLNSHFQKQLNISASMAAGLSSAYFGAYFICPPTVSGWILRRFGFRVTFMSGLAVFAVGCLLFWPSGVKRSFGGFCGSMFVVGAGLATLETAADPFLSICGPPRYSEIRLNLAQAVQGVGSFVAPLLASRVFFASSLDDDEGLRNVQWIYLGVACFDLLLIALFFVAPMPEITDADMHAQESAIGDHDPGPFRKQTNLFLAVWSQFCYVGAQVAVAVRAPCLFFFPPLFSKLSGSRVPSRRC